MKRFLAIVVLIAVMLTACGSPGSGDANSIAPSETGAATDASAEDAAGGDFDGAAVDSDVYFLERWWAVTAKVEHSEDVGNDMGMAGMFMNYIFNIKIARGADYDEDPSESGNVGLIVDSTISFNSDEAADNLASLELGGDVSGLGLGVNMEITGSYESYENEYIRALVKDFTTVIKDSSGQVVKPSESGYILTTEFIMEYEGEGGQIFYGMYDNSMEVPVQLFVFIEPDDMDLEEGASRPVKVFIKMPGMGAQGGDLWLDGTGQLFLNEYEMPFIDIE